ncbi:MAG: CDP-alcohol phosphatidyltransferase family protein [Acidobacteria bacterium]|nr:CDP-alcohol phosphatidyltransferase family protein [Acidobacteriota bacterium]
MIAASPAGAFHRANTLTYLSLLGGIMAIATALAGRLDTAGALIALAVIADTFDGRLARLFVRSPAQREIGVQLDSLSDAIAFGVAPCICLAQVAAEGPGSVHVLWWGACFAFAACAITRLAFYNVTQDSIKGFIGIPVPVAALVASSVMLLGLSEGLAALAMLLTATAMVMPLPIPRPTGYGLAMFTLWPVALVGLHLA